MLDAEAGADVADVDTRAERKLRTELGPAILEALADPSVTEVFANPADATGISELWVDRQGAGMQRTGAHLRREQVDNVICTVATLLGTQVTRERPVLEGELPFYGCRFEALIPPVVAAPIFCIRKPACVLFPLSGFLRPDLVRCVEHAIRERWNILVCGGTGTGKTTLVNSIVAEMVRLGRESERFVILEDTVEIQSSAPNTAALRTSDHVSMRMLLRATLRLRPDRIIVGEVRGGEALDLLKAWSTGHPGGVATLHANSAAQALDRLDGLAQEAQVPSQRRLIGDAVDLVLHIVRQGDQRRVLEALRVHRFDGEDFVLEDLACEGEVEKSEGVEPHGANGVHRGEGGVEIRSGGLTG